MIHNDKQCSQVLPRDQAYNLEPAELRQQAEKRVIRMSPQELESLSPQEMLKLLHELQVHEIELEMQNEELRRVQVELDALRGRYFDLYDLAPVGYCIISEKGLILETNLTAARLLGVTRGDMVMRPMTRFILSDDQDVFYLIRRQLLETSEPQECDLRMVKNGELPFWTRIEATLIKDTEGGPIFRVVMSDITAHKKTEEALFRSEAHFKLLAETSEQLIAWENVAIAISSLCKKTMDHLGCDIFALYLIDLEAGKLHLKASAGLSDEHVKEIEWVEFGKGINGCVMLGTEPVISENISRASGPQTVAARALGVQAYASFPLLAQDAHLGALGFGTKTRTCFPKEDITLIKTVAAHMATAMQRTILVEKFKEANYGLEAMVHERTDELEKMVEALRQSNVQLEDFAHIASHDLQEPLRKIMTFAERLIITGNTSLNDQGRDYLYRMQQAAGRMRSLIEELVRYSRVTSDRNPLKIINLKAPVEDAVKDLSVLLEETEGHVVIDELPNVEANEVQMRQLFGNLISNAIKYRSNQKPLIRIYSNPLYREKFHEIHVKDNGIGFDEMYLEKIFKPFQRLHGRSSPYKGTGMGLAICTKILEHHGGSITAKSELGKGSTFIVRLPKAHTQIL
jgi:PAS domain S-box-containing protein